MVKINNSLLLKQIITGKFRCVIGNKIYYIHPPTPEQKLESEIIYEESLIEYSYCGALTEDEMYTVLIQNNLWSIDKENKLQESIQSLDVLKEQMYLAYDGFKGKTLERLRKQLNKTRNTISSLSKKKSCYDNHTINGLASFEKLQYIILNNLYDINGEKIITDYCSEIFINLIMNEYMKIKPNDEQLRNISKMDEWRTIWASGRQEGRVFGVPSINLTEEQQGLIAWSKLYDNIHEHPEPPDDTVIEDDDLLDGWLITQQKKRANDKKEIRNKSGADEQFIVVETEEDAKRIYAQNNPQGKMIQKQRIEAAKQAGGRIREQDTPDGRNRIRAQAMKQMREKAKG